MLLDDELRLRMERALKAPNPTFALRALVQNLFRAGYDKEEILEVFSELLSHLRSGDQVRKADENVALDAMDELTCWLHPEGWEEFEED